MHTAFGNDLAIEVRELLDHPVILEHHGAAFACGQRVLVIGDGRAVFAVEFGGVLIHGLDLLVASRLAQRGSCRFVDAASNRPLVAWSSVSGLMSLISINYQ